MNIFVCVKQVPDTETKIQIKDDKSGIKTDSIKWVVNPYDEFAIEEALKLKTSLGAEKVYAVTLGPQKRVQDSLRIALAMGADEGVVIDSEEAMDTRTTAKALAEAINKTGNPGLVLTGKTAIDDNSAAMVQQLAGTLSFPHCTNVTKIEAADSTFKVEREIEGGAKESFEITGPCVLGATKGLNNPRYPSLPGIMKAKKKPVTVHTLADLGVSPSDSGMRFTDYKLPAEKPATKMLEGDVDAQVDQLVDLLKNEAKVL